MAKRKETKIKDVKVAEILPAVEPEVVESSPERELEDIDVSVVDEAELASNLPMVLPSKDLAVVDTPAGKDPLSLYIQEINRYKLLSPDQEKALTKALVETGDIEVAKKLVTSNLRLVVKIAMEYRSTYQNVMDLIQEGNIGLMKAVSKYDPDKGAKLSYYASWWIRSYILKFILDNFRLVKIGTTNEQKKLFYNLMKEKNRLLSMGIEPDTKMISENLGVSEKAVVTMEGRLGPTGGEFSLDRPMGDEGSSGTFADVLASDAPDPQDEVAQAQELGLLNDHLKDFVSGLKERDQDIFKKRLLMEAPPSLQAIADEYGVSRERIRQIEERLLKNLKVYMSQFIR